MAVDQDCDADAVEFSTSLLATIQPNALTGLRKTRNTSFNAAGHRVLFRRQDITNMKQHYDI
jgi:hypothetical protein